MVLSKRERNIGILAVTVLGLLGLYQFVLQPLIDEQGSLNLQIATAAKDLNGMQKLITHSRDAKKELADLTSNGKLQRDASSAETILYRSVRDWAQDAGMTPPSVQPTRSAEKEKDFYKLTYRAQGSGSMAQIVRFLYHVRTATVPVQISELQISTNKENVDDLKLSLTIATIYLTPDSAKQGRPSGSVARAGEVYP